MNTPLSWYQERISSYKTDLQRAQKKSLLISVARLASFVALAYAVWQWITEEEAGIWPVATFGFTVLFVLFIRLALNLSDKKKLIEKLLFINRNEAGVLQHQPNLFGNGVEYVNYNNYAGDLDIFGSNSLFHGLNRTTTNHGTTALSQLLQSPLLDKNAIMAQQEAVKSLSEQKELRQLITAHGLLHAEKEGNLHDVASWLQSPPVMLGKKGISVLRILLPAYNISAIVFYLITDNYFPVLGGVVAGWLVIGSWSKKIVKQHQLLGKKQSILEQYASILKLFSGVNSGASSLLKEQQATAAEAHQSIQQLSKLSALFDQRINMLVIIFLNSTLLYDIQCMWALEKWKAANKDRFVKWIDCVGSIETLNSLATLAFNHPAWIWPEVNTAHASTQAVGNDGGLFISGKALGHPLIPAGESVANDFSIGEAEKLILVTGSNMSGKTTFLRTVGVNLILAQCGAPVCAQRFAFTPMYILSSIRVSDSLQEHTSYFMAELKRLKLIINYLQQQSTPALVLIDEILRGTNSEDKTFGSEQFIKKLLQYNCLTMFATHDLSLGQLEEELPGQLNNYCFESIIRDGELIFDYTLQRGIAKNKNASFLMEKMAII